MTKREREVRCQDSVVLMLPIALQMWMAEDGEKRMAMMKMKLWTTRMKAAVAAFAAGATRIALRYQPLSKIGAG